MMVILNYVIFGCATYMSDTSKNIIKGTMECISPSLYNNRVADGRLNDMWSIGILICILITNENHIEILYIIFRSSMVINQRKSRIYRKFKLLEYI